MNNEAAAALLPCPLCGSSVHVKSSDGLSSILCESPSTCIGSGLGFMFIDEQRDTAIEAWNRRASTTPVASESRGSVPEGWMPIETLAKDHKARFILRRETPFIGYWDAKEGVWKDDGGLLRDPTEWLPTSRIRTAAPAPPDVASGEPPPEQWRTLVDELATDLENEIENRRASELPRRIERDLEIVREARRMLAAAPRSEPSAEPQDWAIAQAFREAYEEKMRPDEAGRMTARQLLAEHTRAEQARAGKEEG